MLVPAEIKVNITGGVADVLGALGNPGPARSRQVWFAEDRAGIRCGELPLLKAGIIVRVRTGEGEDDSTVKLRPCDPHQLRGRWRADFGRSGFDYRVEGDWSDDHHVLGASAVASHPGGSLATAVGGSVLAAAALTSEQRHLARHCADVTLTTESLVPMGPIASTKWSDVALAGLRLNVERWMLDDLDFLELSIRIKPKDGEHRRDFAARAVRKQSELVSAVIGAGLHLSSDPEPKTSRILSTLAARQQRVSVTRR